VRCRVLWLRGATVLRGGHRCCWPLWVMVTWRCRWPPACKLWDWRCSSRCSPPLLLDGDADSTLPWWWGRMVCAGLSQRRCALVVLWWHYRMCQAISSAEVLRWQWGASHCCLSVLQTWCQLGRKPSSTPRSVVVVAAPLERRSPC
jgi:hypothetical protein